MLPETFARKGQFGQWSGDSGWLARIWRDKICICRSLRKLIAWRSSACIHTKVPVFGFTFGG
jgi:hypothetical protein